MWLPEKLKVTNVISLLPLDTAATEHHIRVTQGTQVWSNSSQTSQKNEKKKNTSRQLTFTKHPTQFARHIEMHHLASPQTKKYRRFLQKAAGLKHTVLSAGAGIQTPEGHRSQL